MVKLRELKNSDADKFKELITDPEIFGTMYRKDDSLLDKVVDKYWKLIL